MNNDLIQGYDFNDNEIMQVICDLLYYLTNRGYPLTKALNTLGLSDHEYNEVIRRFATIGEIDPVCWEILLRDEVQS